MTDAAVHMQGLVRLVDRDEKARLKTDLKRSNGREKFLARLRHQVEMHSEFAALPPKGQRDEAGLFKALTALGAPTQCYVIASDTNRYGEPHDLDDSFQDLREMLEGMFCQFSHGTILSCAPGQLALFRTPYPHQHWIVHRPHN